MEDHAFEFQAREMVVARAHGSQRCRKEVKRLNFDRSVFFYGVDGFGFEVFMKGFASVKTREKNLVVEGERVTNFQFSREPLSLSFRVLGISTCPLT
jgi:hypothetical protein